MRPPKAPKAALLKSALCLTTAKPRPSPTMFYFPGLESKPFHDRKLFSWCEHLETNYEVIKQEYLNLRDHKIPSDYQIQQKEHQLHNGKWDWHSYVSMGKRQSQFTTICPQTTQLLESIPGFMTNLPFAYSFFSTLNPKSHIAAHSSPCNIRLRCHFPLIIPSDCGIRVGNEIRKWKEGECMLLDDSYDHEVWNDNTSEERVILLFDLWHPDLVQEEQQALISMFQEAKNKGWLQI